MIKSRRLRWAGHVARMLQSRSAFKILIFSPTGKKSFGSPGCRGEDNIRKCLKEKDVNTRNFRDCARDNDYWSALVNAAMNLRAP
jgi:hypothetical protein